MGLRGQLGQRGYAMAALLVALAVMSVLMTALLPAWRFQARREKELELVFRGEQYVKAIERYERKMGPGVRPPSIDVLVQERFLRKKYKDPMTEDGEFQPLYIGANAPAPGGQGTGRGQAPSSPTQQGPRPTAVGSGMPGVQAGAGGIIGVVSKSKETSIRSYRGATKYNEWRFVYAGQANRPGMPGGGRGTPGIGGRGETRPGFPRGGRSGFPETPPQPRPGERRGAPPGIRPPGQ